MNYELAQELKDAGFPQLGNGQRECQHTVNGYDHTKLNGTECDSTYYPTLSELIEACVGYFCLFELRYWSNKHLTMHWWATAWDTKDKNYDTGGTTPEEAVTRLWLEVKLWSRR